MDGQRLWRRIRRIWVTLGIAATVVFVGWSLLAYRASPDARLATRPDSVVAFTHADAIWSFVPRRPPDSGRPALVFFPGALVDPVAYAPLLHAVATAGFAAYLVELPRRGAFGGADSPALAQRIDELFAASGTPAHRVIAGHSRGGVVATQWAGEPRRGFVGLVLIGTSHPRDVSLAELRIPVTKIIATRDGLASVAEVEQNSHLLPPQTRWVRIDGGNHSQFGWYGFQPGDSRATISAAEQRRIMLEAVLETLGATR